MRVALVSCHAKPDPDADEQLLCDALTARGMEPSVVAWEDHTVAWRSFAAVILRSTWNYYRHYQAFLSWAEETARQTALWNPLPVVRWNTRKTYLLELAARGISVVPTAYIATDSGATLAALLTARGWDDVVIKPGVSAGSWRTLRAGRRNMEQGEQHLAGLLHDGDALIQPYIAAVETAGERALICIDGQFTHGVRKSARFSGDSESVSAAMELTPHQRAFAERVLGLVDGPLLYGRVDVIEVDGTLHVMELELTEPSLYLAQCPAALERFVNAIERVAAGTSPQWF